MKRYTIRLELISPALIGSGEGFGAIIDTDIVFDEFGIPYIPSKRIKGCLRDSAEELCEMFQSSGINLFNKKLVDSVFGEPGSETPAPVYFSNLYLQDYPEMRQWLEYLKSKYNDYITREAVISRYTELRQQTAINENGTAKEHSLRTIRVAKKGLIFYGDIDMEEDNPSFLKLLFFACKNLRRIGTKRNRGFGEVNCTIYDGLEEINFLTELEGVCRQ